jgi:hypothetical protein
MRDTSDQAAAGGAAEPGGDEEAELERLRAENARLREQAGAGRRRHVSWRAPVSVVLIVVGCVLAPVAVIGTWAGTEVSDTGRYVATVEPLIHDPAIQKYLADQITSQVTSRLDITGTISQASAQLDSRGLPKISSLLKTFGPQIASSVTGFIHSTAQRLVASPRAARLWVRANTVAHRALVKVLSGQGNGAISTKNGQVVLNLGPFIAAVKQDLVQHGFSLAGNIPPVSPTIALFQAKDLGKAQSLYRLVTTLKVVLPLVALLLLAAGVWAARGRRRALVRAALGVAGSMLILGIGLRIGRAVYLDSVPGSTLPADAAAAGWDALVHFLWTGLRTVMAAALVIALAAYLTGPSRTAVQTRAALTSGIDRIRNAGQRRGLTAGPVAHWTYQHRTALRTGAVTLAGLIFIFWGEPTALTVIAIAAVLLIVLGLIELIGVRPPAPDPTAGQAAP